MTAEPWIQANTNGDLHYAREPSLAPLNRAFLYGDSVYEVWRSVDGVLFDWDEHWSRLHNSAAAIFFRLEWTPSFILSEIKRTAGEYRKHSNQRGDVYVRLQAFRGGGRIGLDPALASEPGYVILVQAVPLLAQRVLEEGLVLSIAQSLRRNPLDALNPAWKTGNYLNNLLCLREAKSRGADDVVILNQSDEIAEASTSNIAFIKNGRVITPPLSAGILPGITRDRILKSVGKSAGLTVEERAVTPADLPAMEECFLTSSTKDIQPVGAIDDHRFPVGEGTATRRLKQAFAEYALNYAGTHSDNRLWPED